MHMPIELRPFANSAMSVPSYYFPKSNLLFCKKAGDDSKMESGYEAGLPGQVGIDDPLLASRDKQAA